MHTKVNATNIALFKKSHANVVTIYTLEILKIHKETEQHFQEAPQKGTAQ